MQKEIDVGALDVLSLIIGTNALAGTDSLKALTENAKIVAPYTKGSTAVVPRYNQAKSPKIRQ